MDLGFVGDITKVDGSLIKKNIFSGKIPVIAPIGRDRFGMHYNINADHVACKVAEKLKAEKIIMMTDVKGVLTNKGKKISEMNIKKAKKIVSIEGWSSEIFSKLQKQNIEKNDLFYFFPDGYKDLLEYALQNINEKLEYKLKKINLINFPINKRIKKILLLRFDILNEDKEFYKKTFNHLLLPTNNKISKKSLYNSVSTMWYLAGDNSTDFNFYTKRLILSGVYTNALFVFFSKEMKHVEENIDKNLKRISKIPRIKERISFIKDNAPKFLKSFLA